ncbi:MAG TPA: hydroxymethylbilane synthase [Tepidisphaeraceae bacterium]|nr:hydroxymethylbilane synthase [Tepidisphaeraceae bacterium]
MSALTTDSVLRLGTRGSVLAQTQSRAVAGELERLHSGLQVELKILKTSGDVIRDRPLHEFGGKGLFTKEIEQALLAGEIDLAVHSFKDVPVTMPLVEQADLIIAAAPKREDPRDALISTLASTIEALPSGAKVGTGSLRRRCQILALRPDLKLEPIRGNIDTRIRKLKDGQFDAVILAMAGLRRATLFDAELMYAIETSQMLPASGQGALALQCRRDDARTRALLRAMDDATARACVTAERELVRLLEGDCQSPIAALAEVAEGRMTMRAAVGSRGGEPPVVWAQAEGSADDPAAVAAKVHRELILAGAQKLLHGQNP